MMFMLMSRWVQGNHKAEAMLLAISEAGPFKVESNHSGMLTLLPNSIYLSTAMFANNHINTA